MDKAENCAALVPAQQAVVVRKTAAELRHLLNESFALLVVVMKMHLYVTDAQAHHLGKAVEQISPVLFLRVKKLYCGR